MMNLTKSGLMLLTQTPRLSCPQTRRLPIHPTRQYLPGCTSRYPTWLPRKREQKPYTRTSAISTYRPLDQRFIGADSKFIFECYFVFRFYLRLFHRRFKIRILRIILFTVVPQKIRNLIVNVINVFLAMLSFSFSVDAQNVILHYSNELQLSNVIFYYYFISIGVFVDNSMHGD